MNLECITVDKGVNPVSLWYSLLRRMKIVVVVVVAVVVVVIIIVLLMATFPVYAFCFDNEQ